MLMSFFDCWKRSDLDGAMAHVADDIVFEPDLKGTRHQGKDALRALWGKYMEMMKSYDYQVVNLLEADDRVMVERLEIVGSSSGGELKLPIVGVFRISPEDKIASWRDYWDTSMAGAH